MTTTVTTSEQKSATPFTGRLLKRILILDATFGVLLFNLTYRWNMEKVVSMQGIADDQKKEEEAAKLATSVKVFHQVSRSTILGSTCRKVSFDFASLALPQQTAHMSGSMSAPARTLHQRRGRTSVSFLAPNLSLPRKAKAETKSPILGLATASNTRLIVGVFHDIHKETSTPETDERLQAFADYIIKSFEDSFASVLNTPDFQSNLKEYVRQRDRNEAPERSPVVPLFTSFADSIADLSAVVPS